MQLRDLLTFVTITAMLASCATSPQKFMQQANSLSNTKVCRNWVADGDELREQARGVVSSEKRAYFDKLEGEMDRRSLTSWKCQTIIADADKKIAGGILLGIAVVGLAAAASQGAGGGSQQSGYAWDQINGSGGTRTWRCRDKSTGRFASSSLCAGLPKVDSTWPG